ncbi:hypothetical protein D3C78_614920 [compost metagenome]
MSIKDLLDITTSIFKFAYRQRNPVRQQASRVLRVFEAHDISRTQINRVIPHHLRLPALKWTNPDELKGELTQEHLDWIQEFFALEPAWLDGLADEANLEISSYKDPKHLHDWLLANKTRDGGLNFRLYFVSSLDGPFDEASEGHFAVILEQLVDVDEYESLSRFYHLTPGAHFTHSPCVLHLAQVLAIAYYHGAMMCRLRLKPRDVYQLSHNRGLIAEWIAIAKPHHLEADHELWEHYSGSPPTFTALRREAEQSLIDAGMAGLVSSIRDDRDRFMRRGSIG